MYSASESRGPRWRGANCRMVRRRIKNTIMMARNLVLVLSKSQANWRMDDLIKRLKRVCRVASTQKPQQRWLDRSSHPRAEHLDTIKYIPWVFWLSGSKLQEDHEPESGRKPEPISQTHVLQSKHLKNQPPLWTTTRNLVLEFAHRHFF